jgi:hypothetical protein
LEEFGGEEKRKSPGFSSLEIMLKEVASFMPTSGEGKLLKRNGERWEHRFRIPEFD